MGARSPIARRMAPSRVAPFTEGSASRGGGASSSILLAAPCGLSDPITTFSRRSVDSGASRLVLRSRFILASILPGIVAASSVLGPVQGHDTGRGSAAPRSSSICVGIIP